MKRPPRPSLTLQAFINGEYWPVYVYTEVEFDRFWPGAMGVTLMGATPSINLRSLKVSKDTIAHELTHAYLAKKNFKGRSYGKIEEAIAEMIGQHYRDIYRLTNTLWKAIQK